MTDAIWIYCGCALVTVSLILLHANHIGEPVTPLAVFLYSIFWPLIWLALLGLLAGAALGKLEGLLP